MQWKDALDSVPEGNLSDCKSRACAAVFLSNANALKHLDALFVTFLDSDVDLDRITRLETRNIRP
jgi:hypothetical protein